MWWHEQTWPQLDRLDRQTPVVVPLGACEQHGRHLPLFVDSFQVSAISERVEAKLGDRVLVLPTLWLGSSHHHKDFPGTVTLLPSVYSAVIRQVALSVLRAGFERVLFLNGHGGNETPAAQALTELVAEDDRADAAYLVLSSWWSVGQRGIDPAQHGLETPMVSHACEYETSLMLALRPDLVQMDEIVRSKSDLTSDWFNFEYGGRVNVYRRWHRITASGSMGEPQHATADKGAAMLNAVTDEVVRFIEEFATWPKLEKRGPQ